MHTYCVTFDRHGTLTPHHRDQGCRQQTIIRGSAWNLCLITFYVVVSRNLLAESVWQVTTQCKHAADFAQADPSADCLGHQCRSTDWTSSFESLNNSTGSSQQEDSIHCACTDQHRGTCECRFAKLVSLEETVAKEAQEIHVRTSSFNMTPQYQTGSGCLGTTQHGEGKDIQMVQKASPSYRAEQQLPLPHHKKVIDVTTAIEVDSSRLQAHGSYQGALAKQPSVRSSRPHQQQPLHSLTRNCNEPADNCLRHAVTHAVSAPQCTSKHDLRPASGCIYTQQRPRAYVRSRLPADCTAIFQHAFAQTVTETGTFSLHAMCEAIKSASQVASDEAGIKGIYAPCKRPLKRTIIESLSSTSLPCHSKKRLKPSNHSDSRVKHVNEVNC